MTSPEGRSPEPVLSTRAPYVPFVVLAGALIIIAVTVRLLNSSDAPAHPLSGAPVDTDGTAVPAPVNRAASGSLSVIVPPAEEGGPALRLGPAAFPPGASVILSAVLPTTEQTFIGLEPSRLADDGSLQRAEPISLTVAPGSEGRARVQTSVAALTEELGPGVYRIRLVWREQTIGQVEAAFGLHQPSGVAIFDEPRQVLFAPGEYTGVIFNRRGRPRDSLDFTLGSGSSASAGAYAYFNGSPYVLIVTGVWAGQWMPLSDGVTLH